MQSRTVFHCGAALSSNFLCVTYVFMSVFAFQFKDCYILVRSIAAGFVNEITAFAYFAGSYKLMTILTTNVAIICRYNIYIQAHLIKKCFVGIPHLLVGALKLRLRTKAVC